LTLHQHRNVYTIIITLLGAKYCNERVGLSVCPLACFKNHMSKFTNFFCTCYLWSWLGPSLQYVMYFRFCGRFRLLVDLSLLAAVNVLIRCVHHGDIGPYA